MSKNSPKGGLGRGLSSLFGDEYVQETALSDKSGFHKLPLTEVEPNTAQPRKAFDEKAMQDLTESIRMHGVLTPITVRQTNNGYYQIIAGERRWRAARNAGLLEIPAMIIEADDKTVMELALIENLQRQDLNPIEEAEGFQALIQEYGMTQDLAAERVGKSRSAVANSLRLLSLDESVRELVAEGKLTSGHARAVLSIADKTMQQKAAEEIIKSGMTVRQAESFAKRQNKEKKDPVKSTEIEVNYLEDVEKRLEASLGRRVKITSIKNKGTIELEFYGNDDLERLADALAAVRI